MTEEGPRRKVFLRPSGQKCRLIITVRVKLGLNGKMSLTVKQQGLSMNPLRLGMRIRRLRFLGLALERQGEKDRASSVLPDARQFMWTRGYFYGVLLFFPFLAFWVHGQVQWSPLTALNIIDDASTDAVDVEIAINTVLGV